MPKNPNTPITDEMIRAAVCRELDSIEVPPVESAWQRLQARQAPAALARSGRSWIRYCALAALLLFFFGGYGVYHTLYVTAPQRAHLLDLPESADNSEILTSGVDVDGVENEGFEAYGLPFSSAEWELVEFSRDAQDQPADALDGYLFEAAYIREAASGVPYLAVFYTRNESTLLWMQSDLRSRDQFITDLTQLLQVTVETHTAEDAKSRLTLNGLPAVIWEKEGRHYLLWEMAGDGGAAELNRLAPVE